MRSSTIYCRCWICYITTISNRFACLMEDMLERRMRLFKKGRKLKNKTGKKGYNFLRLGKNNRPGSTFQGVLSLIKE